jgi:hypothetical protein
MENLTVETCRAPRHIALQTYQQPISRQVERAPFAAFARLCVGLRRQGAVLVA